MRRIGYLLMPALLAGMIGAAILAPRAGLTAAADKRACAAAPYTDALTAIRHASAVLRAADAYTATATGRTVAKKGFITYEQKIANTVIGRGGEYYARSESSSLFVKVKHEAYLRGGRVAYRNGGGQITAVSAAEYAGIYGVLPGGGIDGHEIDGGTIAAARCEGEHDGMLVYSYEIDCERGSRALKKQMKEFGGLQKLPEFVENSRLTLTVRADLTPVSLLTEEKYTVSVGLLGELHCTQSLACSFVFDDAPVPDEAAFRAAAG